MDKFLYYSFQTYVVTHRYIRLTKMVLMRGHNIRFHWELRKIYFKLPTKFDFRFSAHLPMTSALAGFQTGVFLQSVPELTHSYNIANIKLEKFVCW